MPRDCHGFFKSLAMTKLVLQCLNCHCEGAKRLWQSQGSTSQDAAACMKPPALRATEGELAGGQEKPLWSALREGGRESYAHPLKKGVKGAVQESLSDCGGEARTRNVDLSSKIGGFRGMLCKKRR